MIQANERIIHNGKTYESGTIIEKINKQEAERLVDLGVAFFVSENENSESLKESSSDHEDEGPGEKDQLNTEEELDLIEYSDLKTIAKEVGLDFAGNISKKNLITLIIEEKKVEEVLDLTEDEE